MQLEHPGCANKEHNRAVEQLQTHSGSPSHNHLSWGIFQVWKGHWQGNWGHQRGKYSLLACTHVIWFEAVASCGPKCGCLHPGRLQSWPLFFVTWIVWLINVLEFWGSKGNSRRNAKACREHEHPSWPARQAQTSPKVGPVAPGYRRIPWNDGRSGGLYPELAWQLVGYVFICMRWTVLGPAKYILIVPQKDRVCELRKKVDGFRERFMVDLLTEIHVNTIEGKAMDELIDSSRKNRHPLRKPCMKGTCNDILQAIESNVKSINGPNMIWIRGSPSVGKSVLAASSTTGPGSTCDIILIRPHTIYHDHYGCPLACCCLWSCLLVPFLSPIFGKI